MTLDTLINACNKVDSEFQLLSQRQETTALLRVASLTEKAADSLPGIAYKNSHSTPKIQAVTNKRSLTEAQRQLTELSLSRQTIARIIAMTNTKGQNALHIAVKQGTSDEVRQFLHFLFDEHNLPPALLHVPDLKGTTAMHLIARSKELPIDEIPACSAVPIQIHKKRRYTILHQAASGQNGIAIAKLYKAYEEELYSQGFGAPSYINFFCDSKKALPLHYAAEAGNVSAFTYLLESHDLDTVSRWQLSNGKTILHLAAAAKQGDQIIDVIKQNLPPPFRSFAMERDNKGLTAADIAFVKKKKKSLRCFLKEMREDEIWEMISNAHKNDYDAYDLYQFHGLSSNLSIQISEEKMERFYLQQMINLYSIANHWKTKPTANHEQTFFHFLAKEMIYQTTAKLKNENDFKILTIKDHEGVPFIHYMVRAANLDKLFNIIWHLDRSKINEAVTLTDTNDNTAMHVGAEQFTGRLLDDFLTTTCIGSHADVIDSLSKANKRGITPFHIIAGSPHKKFRNEKWWKEAPMSIDDEGTTLLHQACFGKEKQTVQDIIETYAKKHGGINSDKTQKLLTQRNNEGQTPLNFAEKAKNDQTCAYLSSIIKHQK